MLPPQQKVDYLSTIAIFRDLSQPELMQMDRTITMSTCRTGKIFYMPEDQAEVLFLLKKGRVQLYRMSSAGKKIVVATLGPGAIFGEMALVGQRMHNTYAQALDECTLCVMSLADVERLLQEKPEVAFRLVQALGERVSTLETRLEDIAFKSISARLAAELLQLADEQGAGNTVRGLTHQELAERLGTYRETTTQTLNEFKAEGLIEIGRKRITILDRSGLQAIADS
ncbi:MAG: Crp/Fnr family transcriptional regulator [Anaerolineae bacterium]|nr:Crp/Fnr family transcriptional regulator [Anaerolineae bacterium]MCO5186654.1 Crp/Fnr family transcriptional regulator [Anaerolineae bacterium]MCO5198008.1 Crp/Fnr family transcriptional regulator [Anaerolineae bacterium]